MKPLKLRIMKKFEYNTHKGIWRRFKEVEKIIVGDDSFIKTEADLARYIYTRHGECRVMVLAWQKGVEGFWCFFLGNLMVNGFIRDLNKNKELETLKSELKSAEDYNEREEIENEIDFEKRIFVAGKRMTRRGPYGLIKYRPGQLHAYDELPTERRIQIEPEVRENA